MVRRAGWADIPQLLSYISEFHQVTPWAEFAFSPSAAKQQFQNMIVSSDCCIFMHDHGMIGGSVAPMLFGAETLAQELFWWAKADGLTLLEAFEDWARGKGVSAICMAAVPNYPAGKIYERRGYVPAEHFYVKAV